VAIFAVYDYRHVNGDDSLWGQENGGWDRFTLLNHGVGPGISNGGGMYTVSEMGQAGIGFVINEIQMAEGVTNGSHVLVNGNAPGNGGIFTMSGSAGGPANLFAIGAQNANSGTWPTMMDVAEFLVFERLLDSDEEQDVGGYLADKYGLTTGYTGNLGGTLSNTNVTVTAGTTLELTAEADSTVMVGDVTVNQGAQLTVSSLATAVHVTNLMLEGQDAQWVGTNVVVSGALSSGTQAGVGSVGDDFNYNDLTLETGAHVQWTYLAGGRENHYIDVWGVVTLPGDANPDSAWVLDILDGGGTAPGDVRLIVADNGMFEGPGGGAPDLSNVVINLPPDWTSGGLAVEYNLEGDMLDYLVLKNLSTGIIVVPGDTDGDEDVDLTDYDNLLAQFGEPAPGGPTDPDADFNDDGMVDMVDFEELRANFGTGVPPAPEGGLGATTTPEPATMSLLALGGLLVLRRRRRKGSY